VKKLSDLRDNNENPFLTGMGLDSDASIDSKAFASSETGVVVGFIVVGDPPATRLLNLLNKFIGLSLAKNLLLAGAGLDALA
jgi:hypothetical protein